MMHENNGGNDDDDDDGIVRPGRFMRAADGGSGVNSGGVQKSRKQSKSLKRSAGKRRKKQIERAMNYAERSSAKDVKRIKKKIDQFVESEGDSNKGRRRGRL